MDSCDLFLGHTELRLKHGTEEYRLRITRQGKHGDSAKIADGLNESKQYREDFKTVFGVEKIDLATAAKAIACFERTITAGRSRFDRFLRGNSESLDNAAIRGLHVFRATADYLQCHNGPNFTDDQFHNLGLSYYGRKLQDLGRYEVTKQAKDVGAFKTPTLHNITRTAPYMHNGLFELQGTLNLYNAGMPMPKPKPEQENDPLFPVKSELLKPLGLNARDIEDLTAFLKSLEEPKRCVRPDQLLDEPLTPATRPATTRESEE